MFSRRLTRSIAIGATAIAIGGGAYGIVSATASTGSGTATTATSASAMSRQFALGGGGSNARSGPAAGGSIGKVSSVSTSGFGLLTSAGEKVTVKETSSTKYEKGTTLGVGERRYQRQDRPRVGNNRQHDDHGHAGHRATDKRRVQDVVEGGSLQAWCTVHVEAGRSDPRELQAGVRHDRQRNHGEQGHKSRIGGLPGGIVDRVVKLSNGEYEVHNIGVNWPHHIFVNQDFKVVGAN